jgi:hypothetical protein
MSDNDLFDRTLQEWADHHRTARDGPQPGCLTPLQVVNYADGSMTWWERRGMARHLRTCPNCLRETLKASRLVGTPTRRPTSTTIPRFNPQWAFGLAAAAALVLVLLGWNRETKLRAASEKQRQTFLAKVDGLQQQNQSLQRENAALQQQVGKLVVTNEQSSKRLAAQLTTLEQKVAQLQGENKQMKTLLAKTPPPRVLVALRDVSGNVTVSSDGAVRVAGASRQVGTTTLPASLAQSVNELVTTGKVTPRKPALLAMNTLRSAATRRALRSAQNADKPVPLSPVLTAVRSTRPTLRWKEVPGAKEYQVRVADRSDRIAWEGSVTQTQVTLLAGALQRGQVYFYQVEAIVGEESRVSPAVGFWALNEKSLREVEAAERQYKTSALALASVYEAHGLFEDALAQLERLTALNPTSPFAQAMLQNLRRQLGRE